MYEANTIYTTAPSTAQRAHAVERFVNAHGQHPISEDAEKLADYIKRNKYDDIDDVEMDLRELETRLKGEL